MSESKLSILVVDNKDYMRTMVMWAIKEHQPIGARNGKEAIELLQKNKIDVAIIEIDLPDYKGVQLIKEIKRILPKTFVIVLSSTCDRKTVNDCIQNGAGGYSTKPFQKNKIDIYLKKFISDNVFDELF